MPPFANQMASTTSPPSQGFLPKKSDLNIITINVGGQLFQTTKQTLALSGSNSILSKIAQSNDSHISTSNQMAFIDRDPEIFSTFLSLLRTGNLPSKANVFDIQDLVYESKFYGIDDLLVSSISNASSFEAFNLQKNKVLPLNGRDSVSAVSITHQGSVHVAHGSKITSFDWSLNRKSTVLTEFSVVDSMLGLTPSLVACGATDFSGLQILDVDSGFVRESLSWENQTRSSSTVQAIGASREYLFSSFESGRRNSSTIMVYDRVGFRSVGEIGRQEIYGVEADSGIPATKLEWVSGYGLLMAAGSHGGPSGLSGNVRLYDVRSGEVQWEAKEKSLDCFSDVTVSDNLSAIFKVGVNSGEVYFADLRMLSAEMPWICLGDERKAIRGRKGGVGCKIESHGNQVFCSKGGELELWSEVLIGGSRVSEDELEERVFRKNLMGRGKDSNVGKISHLGFGGNKMVVARKEQQCVEVWQSSSKGF